MTIELPEEQVRRLTDVCRRKSVSRAEVIRRAVADYLDARHVGDRSVAFGIWPDRNVDGLRFERRLRTSGGEGESASEGEAGLGGT